jgi:hypothetical protein
MNLEEKLSSTDSAMKAAIQKTKENLIKLDKMNDEVLNKAHSLLKKSIEEDKSLIQKTINGEKPAHLTVEQWENYKSIGERLLKI